jgi:catechol 2,3-dioxygenase-like lactoylglutathione lyase family enzyme
MLRGAINHIDLTVVDPAASAPFYDAVLGYLGFEPVRLANDPALLWHSTTPGQRMFSIALKPARSGGGAHDRYSPGLHHLAFEASSRDDVDGLHTLLREIGARVLDAPAEYPEYAPDYYAVFFADPDGLKLEFVHMPKPPEVRP